MYTHGIHIVASKRMQLAIGLVKTVGRVAMVVMEEAEALGRTAAMVEISISM